MAVQIDPEQNEPAALHRIGARFDGRRVLEVGCGDGRLTKTFVASAQSVVAIDPEPGARADFSRTAWPPHVAFQSGGIDGFTPAGRRFDSVLFSWSL